MRLHATLDFPGIGRLIDTVQLDGLVQTVEKENACSLANKKEQALFLS